MFELINSARVSAAAAAECAQVVGESSYCFVTRLIVIT